MDEFIGVLMEREDVGIKYRQRVLKVRHVDESVTENLKSLQ